MSSEYATISVCLIGNAPTFVAFEIRRMGHKWFAVEREEPSDRCLVLLSFAMDYASTQPRGYASKLPSADIMCQRTKPFDLTRAHTRERYNLYEPQQRLALLAKIALLKSQCNKHGHESSFDAQREVTVPALEEGSVAMMIRVVQHHFDLHVTVTELAQRLGVRTSTIDRWCEREGSAPPKVVLSRGMMQAVVREAGNHRESLDSVATRLGFSAGTNLARFVRKNFGCTFRELVGREQSQAAKDEKDYQNSARRR